MLHKILPLRRLERAVLLLLSVCLSVSLVFFFLLDSLVLPLLCIVTDTKRRVAQYVRPAKPLPQFPTFRFGKHKLDTDTAHSVPFLTAPVALFFHSFLAFANSSSLFHLVWPSQISLFGRSSQTLVAKMWIVSFWVFPLVSAGMWLGMKALDSQNVRNGRLD